MRIPAHFRKSQLFKFEDFPFGTGLARLGKGKALAELDGMSFLIFGASGLMAGLLGQWAY